MTANSPSPDPTPGSSSSTTGRRPHPIRNPADPLRPRARNRRKSKKSLSAERWQALAKELLAETVQETELVPPWTVEAYNRFVRYLCELMRRDAETLSVYRPLPVAAAFHNCPAHEVIVYGANRGGKTQAATAEVAWALTGTHPVEGKYPRDGGVQICAVGFDERHLSLMYDYLCTIGQLTVFFHPEQFKWVVAVPDNEDHQRYKHLWEKSEPVLPRRLVKGIAWSNKKERVPRLIQLHDGSTIYFYSGQAIGLPKGRKYHLVWLDEEISDADKWIKELRPRLIDFNGRLLWSATAQMATPTYREVYQKSLEPDNDSKPFDQQTKAFLMLADDNFYISAAGRLAFQDKVKDDPLEWKVRVRGEFAYDEILGIPEYDAKVHRERKFPIRFEDTVYALFDPGLSTAAVLFLLCPAPALPKDTFANDFEEFVRTRDTPTVIAVDELYLRNTHSGQVAQQVKAKQTDMAGHVFEDLTVDYKGGKNRWAKEGNRPVMDIYREQLEKYDVKVRNEAWRYGSSDVKTGLERFKQLLLPQKDGRPAWFVWPNCRWMHFELITWKKKYSPQGVMIGYEDAHHHLVDLCRYGAMRELVWQTPPDRMYNKGSLTASKLKEMGRRLVAGKSPFVYRPYSPSEKR